MRSTRAGKKRCARTLRTCSRSTTSPIASTRATRCSTRIFFSTAQRATGRACAQPRDGDGVVRRTFQLAVDRPSDQRRLGRALSRCAALQLSVLRLVQVDLRSSHGVWIIHRIERRDDLFLSTPAGWSARDEDSASALRPVPDLTEVQRADPRRQVRVVDLVAGDGQDARNVAQLKLGRSGRGPLELRDDQILN